MSNKIYVGNLNYDTTEDDLKALFATHGEVNSASIITDRYTGRSRGFGFIEMATDEQAATAITELNNHELDGRQLRVNQAQDKPRRDNQRF